MAYSPTDYRELLDQARQAPDGNWYTPDPRRSGKYLMLKLAANDAAGSQGSPSAALVPGSIFNRIEAKEKPDNASGLKPGSIFDRIEQADTKEPSRPVAAPAASDLPPGAAGYVEVPGSGRRYIDAQGKFIEPASQPGPMPAIVRDVGAERLYNAARNAPSNVLNFASELPGRYGTATSNAFTGSRALTASGASDIRNALYFPTTPSPDPKTWTAGGVLKTGAGLLGQAFSPLTGAINVGGEEIDKLTGVPGTGERAAMLLPVPKVARSADRLRPSSNALNTLVEDIGRENLPAVVQRLEQNPTLSVMDVAPGVQSRAIAIAKGEPSAGQTHLFETAQRRVDERREQTASAFGSTVGQAPDTVALVEQMQNTRRAVGSQMIEPALAGAKPVDVSEAVKAIDQKIGAPVITALKEGRALPQLSPIQQRLLELRQELSYTPEGGVIAPEREAFHFKNIPATTDPLAGAADVGAHGVQSRLRTEADTLLKSASGADKVMGSALMDIRNKLVGAIDTAAGGKYKPGLTAYHEAMKIPDAFMQGMEITSTARTGEAGLHNRPEWFAKWLDGLSPAERDAAQLGARTVIDNHIGTIRQAGRAGTDIPEAPFTRAKLEMLFGKSETDRLVGLLRDEKAKAETDALLARQSVTARALSAQRTTAPRVVEPIAAHAQRLLPAAVLEAVQAPFTGLPGLATLGLMGYGATRKGAQAFGRLRDIARNDAYARIASTTAPQERNALLSVLRARQAPVGQGNKVSNALSNALALPLPR